MNVVIKKDVHHSLNLENYTPHSPFKFKFSSMRILSSLYRSNISDKNLLTLLFNQKSDYPNIFTLRKDHLNKSKFDSIHCASDSNRFPGFDSEKKSFSESLNHSHFNSSARHVIITGSNSGIGKAMAIELANLGMEIVLACRNEKLGNIAVEEIKKKTNNLNVSCMHCDLSSLKSIKKFSKEYLNTGKPLHVLINNAGIMASPKSFTEDGFEMQFGVNHLGHFYLTGLLFERMVRSAFPGNFSRIVIVTSAAEKLGNFDFSDLNFINSRWYNRWNAYAQSKLANCLFCFHLSKKCNENNIPISINCFHPGIVDTMLIRHIIPEYFLSKKILSPEKSAQATKFLGLKTPEEGAATGVFLATAQSIEGESGKYFDSMKISEPSSKARDSDLAEKLWQASEALTNFKFQLTKKNSV